MSVKRKERRGKMKRQPEDPHRTICWSLPVETGGRKMFAFRSKTTRRPEVVLASLPGHQPNHQPSGTNLGRGGSQQVWQLSGTSSTPASKEIRPTESLRTSETTRSNIDNLRNCKM